MAREINRALILHVLRNHEAITRAEIARRLQLSKVTVSAIINDLLEDNLVVEIGEGSAFEKGGRRPIMLSLNVSNHFVIGVDLGTTNTVAAIGDLKGKVCHKIRIPTSKNHSVENILEQISCLIDEIIDKSGKLRKEIIGIGMAVAGQVEKESGHIIFSPHFNWHDVHIAKLVEEKTGIKTIADNCTRVMVIGEVWFGEGKGVSNILFVNLGYGIGSALVIDGKIFNHHSEFGHIFITKKKLRCACGKYGCLEVVASGEAIENQANKGLPGREKEWITAKMVAERAKRGDTAAKKIYNEAGRYLGRGISILANTINTEKIIFGGGISSAGELLLKPVLKEFRKNVIEAIKENAKVCISSLGMDAAVMGSIAMVLNDTIFNYELVSRQLVRGRIFIEDNLEKVKRS
jgi:glucokinase-like ROK family protein